MNSIIEALWKSENLIKFGWTPEPGAWSYRVYVGLVPQIASMTALNTNVSASKSPDPATMGKVEYDVTAAAIQALLTLPVTITFANTIFYFMITWNDQDGIESSKSASTIVEIPPVGIMGKTRKDDPTVNRFIYGFSDQYQKWIKAASSGSGALITDPSDFYKANITSEYTYDTTNIKTIKSYLSDRTSAGFPAKLTTYEWTGSLVKKITVTDTTV
jgi:hypothetical protein